MNKLSEYKVQLLIDMVRVNPGLYDKKHPNFKRIDYKENLWREISDKLNADIKDIKVAWRSLRDQFMKCLKDSRNKTGEAAERHKKYKNYERLSFLTDYYEGERNPLKCDGELSEPAEVFDTEQTTASFDFVPWPQNSDIISEESTTEQWSPIPTGTAKKRKKNDAKQTFPEFLENLASKEDSQESFNVEIFFHSIASTVKSFKLSHREFAGLQSEVMAFVIERLRRIEEERD